MTSVIEMSKKIKSHNQLDMQLRTIKTLSLCFIESFDKRALFWYRFAENTYKS